MLTFDDDKHVKESNEFMTQPSSLQRKHFDWQFAQPCVKQEVPDMDLEIFLLLKDGAF